MAYIWVFVGGGLGSIFRFGISQAMSRWDFQFPFATLLANILSCIVLGFLTALAFKNQVSPVYKYLFMTGFCGGFSTFSTFSNETFQLLQSGEYGYALANVIGSVLVCLICIFIGWKLGEYVSS